MYKPEKHPYFLQVFPSRVFFKMIALITGIRRRIQDFKIKKAALSGSLLCWFSRHLFFKGLHRFCSPVFKLEFQEVHARLQITQMKLCSRFQ